MKKVLLLFFLFLPFILVEANQEADFRNFFVEKNYDFEERDEIEAKLIRITNKIYFYVDNAWWEDLSEEHQQNYDTIIYNLGNEFEFEIYDKVTSVFGEKPIHPVSDDRRISVLFHPMKGSAGGYFNSGDQYSRYQSPRSNEMSLLYLNTDVLYYADLGGFLTHEFVHLLVFNQKERLRGLREEVWLNEARAEYMPTFLGYDDIVNSNIDQRIRSFLREPEISLTEWLGRSADYGMVNLFTQYLVDHYQIDILSESLKSDYIGINSINYFLEKRGYEEDFHQVFNNFKIATLVNDCSFGEKYCFKNEKLQRVNVSPSVNYIPKNGDGAIFVQYRAKNWAPNWHKITGGEGTLKINITTKEDLRVEVPYFLCTFDNQCQVHFWEESEKQEIKIDDFGVKYESVIIMPSIQDKLEGFNGLEESYFFGWEATMLVENDRLETLEKLARLRKLLEELRARITEKSDFEVSGSCQVKAPLYFGITDSDSVRCLQLFLSKMPDVYPEGYVTGNFLSLTEKAVIRFQEKYAEEILKPLNLTQGTGYVGVRTIQKINDLI